MAYTGEKGQADNPAAEAGRASDGTAAALTERAKGEEKDGQPLPDEQELLAAEELLRCREELRRTREELQRLKKAAGQRAEGAAFQSKSHGPAAFSDKRDLPAFSRSLLSGGVEAGEDRYRQVMGL